MKEADSITAKRLEIWYLHHQVFEALEASGFGGRSFPGIVGTMLICIICY